MATPGSPPSPGRLTRSLGFGQVTASGVGIIIGAGIYVLLGAATAAAGAGVWIAFLIAGVLSAVTALSYAELAAMFPSAGAEYDYTRRVAPPVIAFVIGWVMILALVIGASAVALGFGTYLARFVDLPSRVGAWALLGAVTALAVSGIRRSARLTVALSLVQVGGLLVVIGIGIPHLGDVDLLAGATTAGTTAAAALVFFAFIGFDEVITLAEETRDPARTVPRALLTALAISTFLYVGVAIAGVSVLGAADLGASDQPLAAVMASAIGPVAGDVIAVVALIATTNTTLLMITAASRLQYGMADTGALPSPFGRLNRRRAPMVAILTAAAVAAGFVAIGNLELVAGVTDFAVYVVFVAVNVAVITLRFRQPKRLRPFRIPVSIGRVPITPLLALGTIAVLLPRLAWSAIMVGSAVAALGAVTYVVLQRTQPAPPPARLLPEDPMRRRTSVDVEEARAVADILRVDFKAVPFTLEDFRRGMHVELEHGTADPDTNVTDDDLVDTGKIALVHLNEFPDYYERLEAMEAQARRERDQR